MTHIEGMTEQFERRKLLLLFVSLLIGLSSAWNLALLALLGLPIWVVRSWKWRLALGLIGGLGFGLRPQVNPPLVFEKAPFSGVVRLLSVPIVAGKGCRVLVESSGHNYELRLPADTQYSLGDRLLVDGIVKPMPDGSGYDHGSIGVLQGQDIVGMVGQGPQIWKWSLAVRRSFDSFVIGSASVSESELLEAMTFNVTSGLDPQMVLALRRTGTAHLVATAGLHLGIVAGVIFGLLTWLRIKREWQILLLCGFLCVYAGASGLRPPIIRALIVALCVASAYLVRREPDLLTSLATAGILIVLRDPTAIMEVGFWLTLAAVTALVLFPTPDGKLRPLKEAFRVSGLIALATAPLIAYEFGEFSVVSIAVNMLVVPCLGLILSLALGCWLFGLVRPLGGLTALQFVVLPLLGWVSGLVRWAGDLPWASVSVGTFHPAWLGLYYASAVFLWRPYVREA